MSKRGGGLVIPSAGAALSADEMGDSDLDGKTTSGRSESSRPLKKNMSKSKSHFSRGLSKTEMANRPALKEIANTQGASDTEGIDDLDKPAEPLGKARHQMPSSENKAKPLTKREKTTKTKAAEAKQSSKTSAAASEMQDLEEIQETQDIAVHSKLARSQKAGNKKPKISKADVIPETQLEAMDIDLSEINNTNSVEDPAPRLPLKSTRRVGPTVRNRQSPVPRSRAGSASDAERGGDTTTRRKLNELTKKFDALELKYRDLKEIGAEGNSNFDELKKQADEKTKAANDLIASLRAELAAQTSLASEASETRRQLETQNKQNSILVAQQKVLESSLQEAQNENKTLSAKLSATRNGGTSSESVSIVPGSAMKGQSRTLLAGSAEATNELQKRQLKEDLYSDLTGLILRDVKRGNEQGEDIYDCIQTGRNGTLHFHLSIANPGSTSYEDAEFQYTPLLDESRDRDLLEILPDYLAEEICFPRSNAAKFYARVVDCMTKKVEFVDD